MQRSTPWEFSDDRGRLAVAGERPSRIITYLQAGATLWDHGVRPVGLFGSQHDGAVPDRTKSGELPREGIPYLGAGAALHPDTVLGAAPDLVVAVTYDGETVYGLAAKTAQELEAHVPVVALGVGPGRGLAVVRERFAALAGSLGAGEPASAAVALDDAEDALRTAAGDGRRPRVLALSAAGPEQAYLARPGAWPDLRTLREHGVELLEPAAGPGANWATATWADVAALAPDIVLSDVRANAAPPRALRGGAHWRAVAASARLVGWNPEAPCSRRAHARFFHEVAAAVRGAAGR